MAISPSEAAGVGPSSSPLDPAPGAEVPSGSTDHHHGTSSTSCGGLTSMDGAVSSAAQPSAAAPAHSNADHTHGPSPLHGEELMNMEAEASVAGQPEADDPFAAYHPAYADECVSDEEDVFGHGCGLE